MPEGAENQNKKLIPISEAADFLGVSSDTVRRWDRQGMLHADRPTGTTRYFSLEELNRVKFARPLTIAETAHRLGLSIATLRRLEERGLLVPRRVSRGKRVYDREVLEQFLNSEYFLRQGKIEEKILAPAQEPEPNLAPEAPAEHLDHTVLATKMLEHHGHIKGLLSFRKLFVSAGLFVLAAFLIATVTLTILIILSPEDTVRRVLTGQPSQLALVKPAYAAELTDDQGERFDERSLEQPFIYKVLKPFDELALALVKLVSEDAYARAITALKARIQDINDVFSYGENNTFVPSQPLALPESAYLRIPDTHLITNLNAEFLRGLAPGSGPGNLLVLDANGKLPVGVLLADSVTSAGSSGQLVVANASGVPTFVTMGTDATLAASGALTIAADAVALTTDTTGNYVATITAGSGISGTASSEGATPTIALGALTANWDQTGAFDISLNNTSSELQILEAGASPTLFGIFDIADLSTSSKTYTFPDATGTAVLDSASQTLTNKTLTDPTIQGTVAAGTGLTMPAFTLSGTLSRAADQTIDLTGAATRTLTLQNSTASQVANFDVDGALLFRNNTGFTVTLSGTPTANRVFTFPDVSDDTVALLAATQTLTNKTVSGGTFSDTIAGTPTFSGALTFSGGPTFSTTSPTFSTMTAGSVLFAGTSGLLSQDNSNLFWDDTNNRLGIGTASLGYSLDVRVNSNNPVHIASSTSDAGGYIGTTGDTQLALLGGASVVNATTNIAKATTASMASLISGTVQFFTNSGLTLGSNFTPTERVRIDSSGNVGIGVTPAAILQVSTTSLGLLLTNSTIGDTSSDGGYLQMASDGTFNIINQENVAMQLGTNAVARINISSGGNIALGQNVTSGTLTADIGGTGTGNAVCHSGAAADTNDVGIVDCTSAPSQDYAELYPIAGPWGYGDVVAATGELVTQRDGKVAPKLRRSSLPYQMSAIGVVVDNYGDFSSVGHNVIPDDENPRPVALSGRVPVKVTNDNGLIKVGDYLTASYQPGRAMKATAAGRVIGIALEDWDPSTSSGSKSQILMFVDNSYYNPASGTNLQGQHAQLASLIVSGEIQLDSLQVALDARVLGELKVDGDITLAGQLKGGTDTRGAATVKAGETKVTVSFSRPYQTSPIITATPTHDPGGGWWVEQTSPSGFNLTLASAPPADVTFLWIAIE